MTTSRILLVAFFLILFSQTSGAQTLGARMAHESAFLILSYDMSHIASRDNMCSNVSFNLLNVEQQINVEIRSFFVAFINSHEVGSQRENSLLGVDNLLQNLRNLRGSRLDGQLVSERTYEELKRRALEAYGVQGACSAIAASISTIIQQKRIILRSFADSRIR
jgi:hypothetical protein